MTIANIHNYKNGKKRVDFLQLGIYELLRNKLNFRFTTIDKKGYYFEYIDGKYRKSDFHRMQGVFMNFLNTEFENLEVNGEIKYLDFMNEYLKKSPLTNGKSVKEYLSKDFELCENDLHLLKMETDQQYRHKIIRINMNQFIKDEGFIKASKWFRNFFNKTYTIYYKQVSIDTFLLLEHRPSWNNDKGLPAYSLFKVKAKNLSELYKKGDKDIKDVAPGFSLESDLKLYEKEKNV